MRYFLIFLVVFVQGCSGQSNNTKQAKIDTAKLFNPNDHPDNSGAEDVNIFRRNIVLTQPDFYAIFNNNEYKFETLKELSDFLKTNKEEIQRDLFYVVTDSNTAFKRILSTIEALKENQIMNYKVINIQQYLTPPEPVTIQTPTSVVTTFDKNDSTNFSIEILQKGFGVRFRGQDTSLSTIPELNDFIASHKSDIRRVNIITTRQIPYEKFRPVIDVLKKNEFYKYNLVEK